MPDLSTVVGMATLLLVIFVSNPKTVEVIDAAVGEHADRYLEAKRLEAQTRRKEKLEERRKMRMYSGKGARSSRQR